VICIVTSKEKTLDKLYRRIHLEKRKSASFARFEKKQAQRIKVKKLLAAGAIFEEAGILDSYNRDDVLKALLNLKKEGEYDGESV